MAVAKPEVIVQKPIADRHTIQISLLIPKVSLPLLSDAAIAYSKTASRS